MVADVLVELSVNGINKTFSYLIPNNLNVIKGIRVIVPFGKNTLEGFVLNIREYTKVDYELKAIIDVVDQQAVLNDELINLGKYMSKKYYTSLIKAYQTMLPVGLKAKKNKKINKQYITYVSINTYNINDKLNNKQQTIVDLLKTGKKIIKEELVKISISSYKTLLKKDIIKEELVEKTRLKENYHSFNKKVILTINQQKIVDEVISNKILFKPYLLHGVTGCGKTEIYINIVENIIEDDKQAIILVPEISLTPQFIGRFKNRFGEIIAILHSGLSDGEKFDEWNKIRENKVKIVIGARSAIFAPLNKIGIIILDEEHADTYKQENNPKYNAIDIAIQRCKNHKCPLLLGSATPSIDSYTKCKLGIYTLLELKERVNAKLPKVTTIDMKKEIQNGNRLFSVTLREKLNNCITHNEQAIILLNRRGYTTTINCHDCGYKLNCPKCDIPLTYHKKGNYLLCHYCNFKTYKPLNCPNCHSNNINEYGIGTEKLEEEIVKNFPSSSVVRMDTDTTQRKGSYKRIIDDFQKQKYNILIGTQMISKGLDFDNVTLVGVINADATLNIPDFRSAERTFALLSQVAGRAGRNKKEGEVIIQGFNINHYSILAASIHDYKIFYNTEMKIRKQLNYPPYYNLCVIKTCYNDENILWEENIKIVNYLRDNTYNSIVLGPSPCSISKINNIFYNQIIIKYKKIEDINDTLNFLNNQYLNKKIKFDIDINPYHI